MPDGKVGGAPCGACREMMVQIMPGEYQDIEILLDYTEEKIQYNRIMLEKEHLLESIMAETDTPLETAIKLARAGNYIDFSAMIRVSEEGLNDILQRSVNEVLPAETVALKFSSTSIVRRSSERTLIMLIRRLALMI